MKINISDKKPELVETNALVYAFSEEEIKEFKPGKNKIDSLIEEVIKSGDFKGTLCQTAVIYTKEAIAAKRIFLVGKGKEKEFNVDKIRRMYSAALSKAKELKIKNFSVVLPDIKNISYEEVYAAITEGILLSDYEFDKYKTESKEKNIPIESCTIICNAAEKTKKLIEETQVICENVCLVRDMVNESSYVNNPIGIANLAKNIAAKNRLKLKIIDEKMMKQLGMNLILAVSSASCYPPRLVIVEYDGNKSSKEVIALVGKGITFDTGGVNLKPTGFIETMKSDMAGAATVLGVIKAASELKIKKNIIAVMPLCENAIGSKSYKPGDVYKSYSGKTVEIANTDAEGRLILADALAYTEKTYEPKAIINLATLTGAMVIALGTITTGMFSNDEKLAGELTHAGLKTYERVWQLPMYEEYKDDIKSDIADMKNTGASGSKAASIAAALFLANFVEKAKFAHLDIAGTSWLDAKKHYLPKGATGVGVRLLVRYLMN